MLTAKTKASTYTPPSTWVAPEKGKRRSAVTTTRALKKKKSSAQPGNPHLVNSNVAHVVHAAMDLRVALQGAGAGVERGERARGKLRGKVKEECGRYAIVTDTAKR